MKPSASQVKTYRDGNYEFLEDFYDRKIVRNTPFNNVQEVSVAVSSNHILLDNTMIISGNLAIGQGGDLSLSEAVVGGNICAKLPGSIGTGSSTAIIDVEGNPGNVVSIRDAGTGSSIISGGDVVYGLIQADNTASDNDPVGAPGSENLQMSFVTIDTDGNLSLVSITGVVQFQLSKLYSQRYVPKVSKEGGSVQVNVGSSTVNTGSSNVFVYRPYGGVQNGNVYTSFSDLYTSALSINGVKTLIIDNEGNPTPEDQDTDLVELDPGTYNLSQFKVTGMAKDIVEGNFTILDIDDSVTLTGFPDTTELLSYRFNNTSPIYTCNTSSCNLNIDMGAIILNGSSSVIQIGSGVSDVRLKARETNLIRNGSYTSGQLFDLGTETGVDIEVKLQNNSYVEVTSSNDFLVAAPSGNVVEIRSDATSSRVTSLGASFLGTAVIEGLSKSTNIEYTPVTDLITKTILQDALEQVAKGLVNSEDFTPFKGIYASDVSSYNSGDYIYWNGKVWRATTSIDQSVTPIEPTPLNSEWLRIVSLTSSSAGIGLLDEGTPLGDITSIDFVGADVSTGNDSGVGRIYIPPLDPVSNLNTTDGRTDALIPDITTSARRVASPSSEGSPFSIGDFIPGNLYNVIRDNVITYETNEEFSLPATQDSTITVVVTDPTGTPIASHTTGPISSSTSTFGSNISISVNDYLPDSAAYKATLKVDITIDSILPNSGRFNVEITHDIGGTTYTKTQSDIFYDSESSSVFLGSVSIAENTGVFKYLSGIKYYDIGSTFTLNINSIGGINADSFPTIQINVDGGDFLFNDLDLTGAGDLLSQGWTTSYNVFLAGHTETMTISAVDETVINPSAIVSVRYQDWSAGPWVDSPGFPLLMDTQTSGSTDLIELFVDEDYRKQSDGSTAWGSSNDLSTVESGIHAQVVDGVLKVPDTDYSTYNPTGNPDYSSLVGTHNHYYRRFIDAASLVRGSCSILIEGFTLSNLQNEDVKIWIDIPGKFASPCFIHGTDTYNFATFSGDNDPIRKASSTTNKIDVTFGGLGLDSGNNYFILHVEIVDSAIEIESLTVQF